jgi:uncharacterized protein YecE (DUF72 family)
LTYYQNYFDVVEINSTFYRSYDDATYLKWKKMAGRNFKFIIKVPRYITHTKRLKNCKPYIEKFCRSVALLKNKLALILLQLPPSLPYDPALLKKALLAFDDPTRVVVEFRNSLWFTDEVKEMLTEIGCIYCAADSPNTKLLSWVTSPIAYIRLHGRTKWFDYRYTLVELKEVVKIIKEMKANGAKTIYILFNNDYYTYAIENAASLRKLINKPAT